LSGHGGADGLLQRFGLMVYPDVSPDWEDVDEYPNKAARKSVNELVRNLHEIDVNAVCCNDEFNKIPYLHFNNEAQEIFIEWRKELEQRLRSGEEHPAIVSHLSKYRKLAPSIALINHLCVSTDSKITEESLTMALGYCEYLESHARRIYSQGTQPGMDAAKTVLIKLKTKKLSSPFTLRMIYKNHWAGLDGKGKAQQAIDVLLDYGHVVGIETSTGGRPTTEYCWVNYE
jgi:hypothetical protein